jgi:hypothetical protein
MNRSVIGGSIAARPGLGDLDRVELSPRNCDALEYAMAHCGGDAATRNRKRAEARELLALSQIAPTGRIIVEALDLREDLRAMLVMQVPVACRPGPDNEPQICERALIGFTYPNEGFRRPLPGSAFFQILLPRNIWLAQIKQPEQSLCIAPQIPAGTRTAMLLLRAYGALSMQSIQIDDMDPAGVFNVEIAHWWQENLHRVPLTSVALLGTAQD